MNAPRVSIVDYQMGNLRSVQKALEHVGAEATITNDPAEIAAADRLILPGVGAFRDAIREIRQRDLVGPIKDFIDSGRPFLGICLGLQLLFDVSEKAVLSKGSVFCRAAWCGLTCLLNTKYRTWAGTACDKSKSIYRSLMAYRLIHISILCTVTT